MMGSVIVPAASLDEAALLDAVRELGERDRALGTVVARYGPPPLWARPAGFPTLVLLILEQQVSLASARAAYDRLVAMTGDPPTPDALLALADGQLLAAGFSRQKTRYARALAAAVRDGSLDVDGLAALEDDGVDAALTALPGIGPWTSTIYRLMVLCRPDAWPIHDIALAQAYADLHGLAVRPRPEAMTALAEGWRPWRAVAARILWHQYLSVRAERRAARTSSASTAARNASAPTER
jgi:DNA-3-methyladenine glycosylase II